MPRNRLPYPSADAVYRAAALWRDRCVLGELSLFDDRPGGMLSDAEVLISDFVQQPDQSGDDFLTKLRNQLGASGTSAVQLAAELLFVHLLIARSSVIGGPRKREIVTKVLGFAAGTSDVPEHLARTLDSGLVHPGQAFHNMRWRQFAYLIEAFATLKRLSLEDRRRALSTPRDFIEVLETVDAQGALIQRSALEHLLFPDDMPPVMSQANRASMLQRWSAQAADPGQPEQLRLAAVTQTLATNSRWRDQEFVNLYRSPHVWEWSEPGGRWMAYVKWAAQLARAIDLDTEERDYKLVAYQRLAAAHESLELGDDDWTDHLRQALKRDNNLVDWRVAQSFLDWVIATPGEAAAALTALWRGASSAAIDDFLERVPDTVAHQSGARLSLASFLLGRCDGRDYPQWRAQTVDRAYRLTGFSAPEPTATDGERYEIFLTFLDEFIDTSRRYAGLGLRDRLDAQGVFWALHHYDPPAEWSQGTRDAFAAWRSGKGDLPPATSLDVAAASSEVSDEGSGAPVDDRRLGDLADELHLDEAFLDEVVQLIRDKGQCVFYGPPGTGKTFVARELATWLAGSPQRTRLVQFHSSYAYEDFVEGLRPHPDRVGFQRVDGPLLEISKAAADDPGSDYVLIIDELNRGNVARVFGELYFLLEYRHQPARLMYSQGEFRLPDNLFLIATMNTADRSIGLLDTALRRRFYFVGFIPGKPPVNQVLRRYLQSEHEQLLWVADVVDRANELLADAHSAIGPSHFMRPDLDETWIRRAWQHSVIPTLEDQFFGQEQRLADFDLDKLRAEVSAPGEDDSPA